MAHADETAQDQTAQDDAQDDTAGHGAGHGVGGLLDRPGRVAPEQGDDDDTAGHLMVRVGEEVRGRGSAPASPTRADQG